MKKTSFSIVCLLMVLLVVASCGPNPSKYSQDGEGFAKLQEDFKAKFGADAYYTDIAINFTSGDSHGSGLGFNVTVTNDPASLKMQEWVFSSYGGWRNTADVTLEIEGDSEPEEFMYQLGDQFSLKKVGELIELSRKKLAEEKQLENAVLNLAMMNTPDSDDASETRIVIMMKPENGGTTFTFRYDLDGNLEDFN